MLELLLPASVVALLAFALFDQGSNQKYEGYGFDIYGASRRKKQIQSEAMNIGTKYVRMSDVGLVTQLKKAGTEHDNLLAQQGTVSPQVQAIEGKCLSMIEQHAQKRGKGAEFNKDKPQLARLIAEYDDIVLQEAGHPPMATQVAQSVRPGPPAPTPAPVPMRPAPTPLPTPRAPTAPSQAPQSDAGGIFAMLVQAAEQLRAHPTLSTPALPEPDDETDLEDLSEDVVELGTAGLEAGFKFLRGLNLE